LKRCATCLSGGGVYSLIFVFPETVRLRAEQKKFVQLNLTKGNKGQVKMKVRASIKRRCEFCQIIKRNGTIRVICSRDPRHKQRQG